MSSTGFFRTLSAAAILCGLSTITSSGAFASENPPLDAWTVGPINVHSDTGVGYCSMKTSYGSGQSLVFARDQEGSNSLAVDFKQKTLETGRQYAVTLRVGSLSRHVPAIAATPGVLIAQTGFDTSLYSAMARRDSLQVDMQGLQFNFGLEGSAEGLKALGECAVALASGRIEINPPVAVAAVAAKPILPVAELRKPEEKNPELEKLRFENQVLQDERAAIVAQLEAADEAQKKLTALKAENERLRLEAAEALKIANRLEKNMKKAKPPVVAVAAPRKTPGELLRQEGAKMEKDWPIDASFQDMVSGYLSEAATACGGDFAQSMGEPESLGDAKMLEAETACMSEEGDKAAALLFVGDQGKFIVYAKDGAAGQMDLALAERSALLEKINGSATGR